MNVEQPLAGFAQLRHRRATAIDPCTTLALGIDRAAHEQPASVAGVGLEAGFGQPGHERWRQVELGGDLGAGCAFPHHAGFAAAAECQLQRVDEDRLASAGLAGEHGQAGAELELELVDDDEVAQCEAMQH